MKHKLTGIIAVIGLILVVLGILSRHLQFLSVDQRTGCFIIGFALMLLGTLWRVVIEMNDGNS